VKNIKAPTLITQGQADSLFPLNESYKTALAIKVANPKLPLAMIWHAGGHDGGVDESKFLEKNYLIWFNRYLKGEKTDIPTFQFTNINGSISLQDSTVIPKVFAGSTLPISGAKQTLPIVTAVTALSYPIGGVPTAISALPESDPLALSPAVS
jgi:ABC-2 type transport system ATP-binding protein